RRPSLAALPLDLGSGPTPRERYFHLFADREPGAVAHDLAYARFGDAVAAIENVLRIQLLKVRCSTRTRRSRGFDTAACSVTKAPVHFRIGGSVRIDIGSAGEQALPQVAHAPALVFESMPHRSAQPARKMGELAPLDADALARMGQPPRQIVDPLHAIFQPARGAAREAAAGPCE